MVYCIHKGCGTVAIFNYPNKNGGQYCSKHKKVGMVNKKKMKCIYPNCNLHPNFNYPGKKGRLYCGKHKKEGMVNLPHFAKLNRLKKIKKSENDENRTDTDNEFEEKLIIHTAFDLSDDRYILNDILQYYRGDILYI